MKKSELCYATWSWGGDRGQIEQSAREISEIGYKKFETTECAIRSFDYNADEFRAMLERYSLEVASIYFIMPPVEKESSLFETLERDFEFMKKLGIKNATVQANGGRPDNDIMDEASRLHTLNVLKKFSNIAKSYGIEVSLHPHVNTYCMYEDEINFVLDNLGPEIIGLAPDTAHMAAAGADPVKIMEKYADRITFTHLKDYYFSEQEPLKAWAGSDFHVSACFRELGKGALDLPKMINILEKVDYNGPLCIELDRPQKSNFDSAKISYEYLSKFTND